MRIIRNARFMDPNTCEYLSAELAMKRIFAMESVCVLGTSEHFNKSKDIRTSDVTSLLVTSEGVVVTTYSKSSYLLELEAW